ncbi:hypothetical protein L2D14_06050 [Thalassospiraceae bacterium LMO-JJ14]|nr:hypothetical protein L2D14_06050 [Thalassospiraceae bacterium LMO-JJ14]
MGRLVITYVLPLLLPFLMYLAWNAYARAQARKTGGEEPSLQKGPIFWSIIAGFILLAASLITLALTGGEDPDSGRYIAPRYEDGKILPPRYEKVPGQ